MKLLAFIFEQPSYSLHAGNLAVQKMSGNELKLVNSFSVMLGWVEPALSK